MRSHQIWGVTFDEVTPDLRSDAIIGCLIQSLNVKLITFFNQSQRRADPLTQGTFAMRIIVSTITMDRLSISKFQIFHIYGEWTRLMIYQSCQINNFLFAKLLQHLFLIQSIRLVCNESPIFRDNLHYHHHFIHSFQEITQSSSSCVIKFQVQRKIFHKRRLSNIHVGKMKMSRYLEPGKTPNFLAEYPEWWDGPSVGGHDGFQQEDVHSFPTISHQVTAS